MFCTKCGRELVEKKTCNERRFDEHTGQPYCEILTYKQCPSFSWWSGPDHDRVLVNIEKERGKE